MCIYMYIIYMCIYVHVYCANKLYIVIRTYMCNIIFIHVDTCISYNILLCGIWSFGEPSQRPFQNTIVAASSCKLVYTNNKNTLIDAFRSIHILYIDRYIYYIYYIYVELFTDYVAQWLWLYNMCNDHVIHTHTQHQKNMSTRENII